ncbi:MAG: ribonuclease [Oscillospiraceae bacterium]|nr:ribonuclease [Oscillospiraceae bacterium]
MKKIRRYLPVLILVLALLILFWPAGNNDTGTEPALPTTEYVSSSPDAGALPDGGELQLLEPSPDAEAQIDHSESESEQPLEEALLPEDGSYTSKEDVSLYLMTYGHLPFNFVTKDEAEKAGWNGGSLEYVLPGKCIGGDRFGNREGQLPKAKGRTWRECDINTLGKRSRGPERLVYSNDGLIYYTPDHYETFTACIDSLLK